ncbi:putative cytosine deaminase [Colletotrichum spaethianum]|uniref:Cytosine deaminase n=1 Tax=Colletotrichum spaethianum TaxID=700344 RepID=A0AA37PGM1_9PEZI|nr:putative cytosine deaminase [Colletotrichum spaethianum]GKT51938.1 putative cytosine deaminase [Colletotrichum spaethianum]
MGPVYAGLVLLPCLWIASQLWTLYANYRAARLTGLPIVVLPYNPDSVLHIVFAVPLRPLLKRLLPARAFAAVELAIFGWEFRDKAAVHARIGPAFMIVTTGLNQLVCADPAMAQAILAKRKEFILADISIKIMSFLGMNVLTSNGESWSRQRRIVAPALNERISPDVWKETAEQATSLADLLLSSSSPSATSADGASSDTLPGLRSIAINVLTRVAYGHRKPFALPSLPRDPKAPMSYVDGISLCAELLAVSALVPAWLLRLPIMPKLLQTLAVALTRLPDLTRDMLDQERRRSASTTAAGDAPDTIMSMLVRLSDQEKNHSAAAAPSEKKAVSNSSPNNKTYLTEEEIAGNLFIFTVAGFDTTANTMAYAVAVLAACPEWQTWIQAEIDAVLGPAPPEGEADGELPDYATAFPKLTRCLAVMFETLRLFPPLTHIMRFTVTPQTMSSSAPSPFSLQAPSIVYINTVALHTSPSTWGPDALDFKPTRWLQPGGAGEADATPQLMTPPRGTFLPWSSGPRMCPGQKMSQVEFVTVIATLFRKCTAEPVPRKGESMEQARQRLLDLTQDSQPIVTLQMKRPKDVLLRWTRR